MNHKARKRFGQNFLQDKGIIDQILASIHPQAKDNILEIGPGLGAITLPLLRRVEQLRAVEIDRDLQAHLASLSPKLELIAADALTVDYSQFGKDLRIVGNLPYNISTPLLLHLLTFHESIADMHFMLQKEVVSRLAAAPGSKAYGRLSVIVQYYCEVEAVFDVPPEAFDPKPKVDSAVVRLVPYKSSPYDEVDVSKLEQLVAKAFNMRRKTLANNLKGLVSAEALQAMGIDPIKRPEQITISEFIKIVKGDNFVP